MISVFHGAVDLPLGVSDRRIVAFVIELLSAAERNFHLDPGILQIYGQGDNGKPVLFDFAVQAADLALMHQKPAGTERVFVEDVSLLIRRDMQLLDEDFSVLDLTPGLF